ncbi:MerC domain-containing protein [Flavobacterium sp. '19STA2R22 D10 B1']|uniref:MerC domain-containing protein n=1 Tax=Flavobacterium aerium TaxID=3037261 RepID=UPI00278C5481|nr:MerC domain-containing protein [Flavobacterium sp. '19STA2R22 D10 B1']
MKKNNSSSYDILGISSATLCLIHCLAFPLLTIIPLGISHNPWIDFTFATIGLFAVVKITKKTDSKWTIGVLWLSIALIYCSVILEIILHHHSNLIYLGGAGLIIGHIINFKNHRHE